MNIAKKFRKKPVEVAAIQYTGNNRDALEAFVKPNIYAFGWIYTPEGQINFRAGDWIIKGVKGEFYPIKNDIFLATYEEVIKP